MDFKPVILSVSSRPQKPFSIRKKNTSDWLCANTDNPRKWHYAQNPGMTGVTQYATWDETLRVCVSLYNHEIIEFVA